MSNITTSPSVETLSLVAHNQVPVVTTELLAQLYGTESVRIQQNHHENKIRFVEGKHFFKVTGEELKKFVTSLKLVANSPVEVSSKTRALILWTERGAARHAKMLDTDQAWEVFEKLEDCYFTKKPQEQLVLSNGQHYVVAKDGVVIYHKILSDRTAKNYLQPVLPPVDNLAALKKDLAHFCAPEDPHLQITYPTAQRTLSLLSALIVHLENHGFNMALMYQKTQYVQNFLTNYYSRLEAIHYQMNSISKQMSLDAINYAADICKHPTVVSCYGAKIA